jgi:hypothetical protein
MGLVFDKGGVAGVVGCAGGVGEEVSGYLVSTLHGL